MVAYKSRMGGPTCTIFVPYDCDNHCAFCINKKEYADTSKFSLPKILDMIKVIDSVTPYCHFVISGGEPFANIEGLDMILEAIPDTHEIYINTTFPCKTPEQQCENYRVVQTHVSKITSLNISRHLSPFPGECEDSVIAALPVNIRINSVLPECPPGGKIKDFVKRWARYNIPIQLRYDYTKTTLENLYDERSDEILKCLYDEFSFVLLRGSRIRNSYLFEYHDANRKAEQISYHKTLPYSSIVEQDLEDGVTYTILYDILIKQDGELHSDWDGTKLDFEKFKNMKFESDDEQILKRGL